MLILVYSFGTESMETTTSTRAWAFIVWEPDFKVSTCHKVFSPLYCDFCFIVADKMSMLPFDIISGVVVFKATRHLSGLSKLMPNWEFCPITTTPNFRKHVTDRERCPMIMYFSNTTPLTTRKRTSEDTDEDTQDEYTKIQRLECGVMDIRL